MIRDTYLKNITDILNKITETQSDKLSNAAEMVSDVIKNDGIIYIFGCGHSHLIGLDCFYRAGGLVNVSAMLDTHDNLGHRELMQAWERTGVLIAAYAMLAVAFAAVGLLLALLRSVLRGEVFEKTALCVLHWLSVCCFAEGVLFAYVGIYFQVALCLMIAAFFLGVSLRVVKNVIAEAMRYKEENELTV